MVNDLADKSLAPCVVQRYLVHRYKSFLPGRDTAYFQILPTKCSSGTWQVRNTCLEEHPVGRNGEEGALIPAETIWNDATQVLWYCYAPAHVPEGHPVGRNGEEGAPRSGRNDL